MNLSSLPKQIARTTRRWRIAVGLAQEPVNGSPVLTRGQARRSLPGGRLAALEGDVDRVLNAWNQHIPQFLAGMAEARRVSAGTAEAQARMDKLEAAMADVTRELADLKRRLEAAERGGE